MDIATARKLRSGVRVKTDEGNIIVIRQPLSLSKKTTVHKNADGEYLWVGTSNGVWATNRLKKT